MATSRREFLTTLAGAAAAPAIPGFLAGCGSDVIETPADAATVCTGVDGRISSNHGHSISVAVSDIVRGGPRTFTLTSNGGHSHAVTFSDAELQTIANGGSVALPSTNVGGHTHTVTVSCIAPDAGTSSDAGQDSGTTTDAGQDSGTSSDAGQDSGTSDAGSDAGTDAGTDASVACNSVTPSIANDHGHDLETVTQADVIAGTMKTYTVTDDGAGHSHTLELTPTEFGMLQQGMTVMKNSSFDGHMHLITLTCA